MIKPTEKTRVWVTKYALTSGVFSVDAEINDDMATYSRSGGTWSMEHAHGEGRDWHRTEASAKARVETIRQRKIDSLKKQIAKLEAM